MVVEPNAGLWSASERDGGGGAGLVAGLELLLLLMGSRTTVHRMLLMRSALELELVSQVSNRLPRVTQRKSNYSTLGVLIPRSMVLLC